MKHGGGSIMPWGYYAGIGQGQLAIIDKTINSRLYWEILQEKPTICELKPNIRLGLKKDNYTRKTEGKQKKYGDLKWLSQSKNRTHF